MTDITKAVRRLKELREDIERLKAGQNEGGQSRLLRQLFEQTKVTDLVNARQNDRDVADEAVAADDVTTATGSGAGFVWADHSGTGGDQWDLTEWQEH